MFKHSDELKLEYHYRKNSTWKNHFSLRVWCLYLHRVNEDVHVSLLIPQAKILTEKKERSVAVRDRDEVMMWCTFLLLAFPAMHLATCLHIPQVSVYIAPLCLYTHFMTNSKDYSICWYKPWYFPWEFQQPKQFLFPEW